VKGEVETSTLVDAGRQSHALLIVFNLKGAGQHADLNRFMQPK